MAPGGNDLTLVHGENGEATAGSASDASPSSTNNGALVDEAHPLRDDMVVIDDWSQTGQGLHVDFADEEHVPLQQGHQLGRGATGDVYEVVIKGYKLAHKKMIVRPKLRDKAKREIEILRRLSSYEHALQLVGTYTHNQILGLLVYPVAICDLATFFDDVEAWHNTESEKNIKTRQSLLRTDQKNHLVALGYHFPLADRSYKASLIYAKKGCLISAIAFLHDKNIRHKDIKPSNILLSKNRIWLSDFGSATDFTLLSQSATDNERGTPRYFSPEVAAWLPNGRAADIFSLACVLLEILILHDQGTFKFMRENRSADPSFHANTKNITTWLRGPHPQQWSARRVRLVDEIQAMMDHDPLRRPTAKQLMIRITGYDLSHRINSEHSIFGECCRSQFVAMREHDATLSAYSTKIIDLQAEIENRSDELREQQLRFNRQRRDYEELHAQSFMQRQSNETLKGNVAHLRAHVAYLSTGIKQKNHENHKLNASIEEEEKERLLSELDYKREKEEWGQEKRTLEIRVAELEVQARLREHEAKVEATNELAAEKEAASRRAMELLKATRAAHQEADSKAIRETEDRILAFRVKSKSANGRFSGSSGERWDPARGSLGRDTEREANYIYENPVVVSKSVGKKETRGYLADDAYNEDEERRRRHETRRKGRKMGEEAHMLVSERVGQADREEGGHEQEQRRSQSQSQECPTFSMYTGDSDSLR